KMTSEAGPLFAGLDRFECRKRVVADMEAANLLEKIEDHTHQVGHCSRTGDVIEPRVSIQWFVKMQPLAEPAIAAVKSGDITFHPARWSKVYLDWMENIRDWCISRQLWWGHRIPVWYCEDCQEVIVQREDPTQCPSCSSTRLQQDPDVLDTWFSSWLWPFATLGWPKKTAELDYFYPTNVLVSGYDIIFFWIARMIMAGYEFLGEKPFSQVYITSMIKDAQGRIMSKSLKNGIDPIDMIEQYGADAVRYSLVALATEGQDIKLSQGKFEMGRNFGNKVWNTYRFILANRQPTAGNGAADTPAPQLMDRWILSRLAATQDLVAASFDRYKLNDALNAVYDFLWHDYCDWYLELLKDRVGPQGSDPDIVNRVATPVLEEVMILLHPFMPFITEEIWQGLGGGARDSIMRAAPGSRIAATLDPDADGQMRILRQITLVVRNIRGEMSIPPQRAVPTIIATTNTESGKVLQEFAGYLKRMAKVASLEVRESYQPSEATATGIISDMEVYVPLAGLIDLGVERQRLEKERQRLEQFLRSLAGKLQNEKFVANAPADVVQKERDKFAECESNHQKILRTLATLSETS
ncbi:MAG: class I tRNA ligase family protein, partial [Candidatus Marinimicrobia bacterium]|nr:class I tRNA ligase family protein [Candidatus Neomarinimicrobiota bacterium]